MCTVYLLSLKFSEVVCSLSTNVTPETDLLNKPPRKKAFQKFNVAQRKGGKQVVKESENHGRIKRIVCAVHKYQPLEYLRAIASNMAF